jgi:hypothetical protein
VAWRGGPVGLDCRASGKPGPHGLAVGKPTRPAIRLEWPADAPFCYRGILWCRGAASRLHTHKVVASDV